LFLYLEKLSLFFQAEDGIRDRNVTGVQTCALPILEDNFSISVKLPLQKKTHHMNIDDFKKELIQTGLYNKQGKLMKETNIIPENIASMEPVLLNKQNGYALKTIQYIKGIHKEHILGSIHTIWHMQNGEWIILQTEWKEQA